MRAIKRATWLAVVATALFACSEEQAPVPATTAVTEGLLARPRAEQLSTEFDASGLPMGSSTLTVEQLGVNTGYVDAPLKVIELVDFGCGFCRRFQMESFPTIRAEFIETHMIEWKFVPFITGSFANSPVVTEAAECALAQDPRFFGPFQERLWAEQSVWKSSDDAGALARSWVVATGADGEAFDRCMAEDTRMQRVTGATALAAQLGVRGTPTFWIVGGGPIQGALPLETFRELFTQLHTAITTPPAA